MKTLIVVSICLTVYGFFIESKLHSAQDCSSSACKILKDECLQHNLFSCIDYKLCHCENLQSNQTQVCRALDSCCKLHFTPCCVTAVIYKCGLNTTEHRVLDPEYISCAATWRCCKYQFNQQCCQDFTNFC